MSILKVDKLSLSYQNQMVLSDLSFQVEQGDYFCIVGSNGSGKTSLLKCILGLVSYNGKIEFGVPRQEIAYLPQINTIPEGMPATVREVVLTGRQKSGKRLPFYTSDDRKKCDEAMRTLEIESLQKKRITELSGGQQQRALLARALCSEPKVIILDEPTAGLDEHSTGNLYSLLDKLNEEKKLTIIMVTHDLDDVKFCANKVLVLSDGNSFCGGINEWLLKRREGHHHDH